MRWCESKDSHDEEDESGGDYSNFIAFSSSVHTKGSVLKSNRENSQKSSNFTDSDSEESESGDEGAKYASLKDA